MLVVALVSRLRTATLRHSGAFAWKVFATSRKGRFASKLWTLANDEVGTNCRNSSAFCGCWMAQAPSISALAARSFPFIVLLPVMVGQRARYARRARGAN